VIHALNRGVRRTQLFFNQQDYQLFERILRDTLQRTPTRVLTYCVMPNHWHLVLWPIADELPRFMHRLTLRHAGRWNWQHGLVGTGHVYQSPYHALPVQADTHFFRVARYVERNPLRAGLVARAEQWRWSGLWRRCNNCEDGLLTPWPEPMPENWLEIVNTPQTAAELEAIQSAVAKSLPLGDASWMAAYQRPSKQRGRPKKIEPGPNFPPWEIQTRSHT